MVESSEYKLVSLNNLTDFANKFKIKIMQLGQTVFAPLKHSHAMADLTGVLPIEKGGTGNTSMAISAKNVKAEYLTKTTSITSSVGVNATSTTKALGFNLPKGIYWYRFTYSSSSAPGSNNYLHIYLGGEKVVENTSQTSMPSTTDVGIAYIDQDITEDQTTNSYISILRKNTVSLKIELVMLQAL